MYGQIAPTGDDVLFHFLGFSILMHFVYMLRDTQKDIKPVHADTALHFQSARTTVML